MNVLHITPHLGGGAGKVISTWVKNDCTNFHRIISLDSNRNKNLSLSKNIFVNDGFWYRKNFQKELSNFIELADVVVIHFWNHPLLYDVLLNFDWPSCRLVMWCHVSGLYPPYCIPKEAITMADLFVFTSPVSFESPDIIDLTAELKDKLAVVWSTSLDVKAVNPVHKDLSAKKDFVIGYLGTADYAKLAPDFLSIIKSIDIPNVRFEFYSNDSQEKLVMQAETLGIAQKILFKGQAKSDDLAEIYSSFDILLYLLNSKHFGTCEQVLGEAMSYGAVPVVLNNKPESYIVENLKNGIVAHSRSELLEGISLLYGDRDLLYRLSKNAADSARKQYSIKRMVHKWDTLLKKEMSVQKRKRVWPKISGRPEWLYAYSHGKRGKCFVDYLTSVYNTEKVSAESRIVELFKSSYSIYASVSKGSVKQYHEFFPESEILGLWEKLVDSINLF